MIIKLGKQEYKKVIVTVNEEKHILSRYLQNILKNPNIIDGYMPVEGLLGFEDLIARIHNNEIKILNEDNRSILMTKITWTCEPNKVCEFLLKHLEIQ